MRQRRFTAVQPPSAIRGPSEHATSRASHAAAGAMIIGSLVPIAGGRWGSYIGLPGLPVYLADLLIFAGLLVLGLQWLAGEKGGAAIPRSPRILTLGSFAFFALVILYLGFRPWNDPLLAIRDIVPFVYFGLMPWFFVALTIIGGPRAYRWLRVACVVHTLWFTPAVFRLLPEVPFVLSAGAPIFTTRGDFDLVIAALSLVVFARDKEIRPLLRVLLLLSAAASLLAGGSRAGLFAGLVVIVLSIWLARKPGAGLQRRS